MAWRDKLLIKGLVHSAPGYSVTGKAAACSGRALFLTHSEQPGWGAGICSPRPQSAGEEWGPWGAVSVGSCSSQPCLALDVSTGLLQHQPWAATSALAEVTPAPILGEGDCCSCPPPCCRAELSTAMAVESEQELQPYCPEILEKPGRRGEVPASRNQWFQSVPGIFTALKCQDGQGKACTASAAKDIINQGFGHCWPR